MTVFVEALNAGVPHSKSVKREEWSNRQYSPIVDNYTAPCDDYGAMQPGGANGVEAEGLAIGFSYRSLGKT
jgi:hypothetical protein